MSNALIAYGNLADNAAASLSVGPWGTWSAALPLSNLKDPVLSNPARANGWAASFWIDLGAVFPVKVIALIRHSLGIGSLMNLHGFTAKTDPAAAFSIAATVWNPAYTTPGALWPPAERHDCVTVLPAAQSYRYWRIDFQDGNSSTPYVDLGRLFISTAFVPAKNFSYGSSIRYESAAQSETAWDGTEYFTDPPSYRVVRLALDWLTTAEAMTQVLNMQRIAGRNKEVLFCPDPADPTYPQLCFLGRLRALNDLENPYLNVYKTQIEIKEIL